jgi:hypothetical protein
MLAFSFLDMERRESEGERTSQMRLLEAYLAFLQLDGKFPECSRFAREAIGMLGKASNSP